MIEIQLSAEDIKRLHARGMTLEQIGSQIEMFKRGLLPAQLLRPCTVGDGITVLHASDIPRLCEIYARAASSGRVMKFVPASGAATRMFELLHAFDAVSAEASGRLETKPHKQAVQRFMAELRNFAFYDDLQVAMARDGLDIQSLVSRGAYQSVVEYLLTPKGLDYARLPKGLIKFHRYPDRARTPFEEHLVEAAAYTLDRNRCARVHFTVSPEHEAAVRDYLGRVRHCSEQAGIQFDISFSTQKPSTDTIAVDLDDQPLRDQKGTLMFRPGGHGALLENLNDLAGDIIFIKNIDNVVPERLTDALFSYKKALGGYLVELQEKLFPYVEALACGQEDAPLLKQGLAFLQDVFGLQPPPAIAHGSRREKSRFLFAHLNRPLRVCGVVKNEGEPGGGPFWVARAENEASRQIVESSQVDMASVHQRQVWEAATHFNPVDLVCGVRDYQGKPFDLTAFTDPNAGLITVKSKDGKKLKALELPGLWNGAMAHWNTVFVEVPIVTFNPVKTVLDLLRKEHQAA